MVVQGGCDVFTPVYATLAAGLALLIMNAYQVGKITIWHVIGIAVMAAAVAMFMLRDPGLEVKDEDAHS